MKSRRVDQILALIDECLGAPEPDGPKEDALWRAGSHTHSSCERQERLSRERRRAGAPSDFQQSGMHVAQAEHVASARV